MESAETKFLVLKDPGPDPLARNSELNPWEIYYGLKYGSLNPGMVLLDQKSGLRHKVVKVRGVLRLLPPTRRMPYPERRQKRDS